MKCPLQEWIEVETGTGKSWRSGECIKEECAWWHRSEKMCAFPLLVCTFIVIGKIITKIEDKMPHTE